MKLLITLLFFINYFLAAQQFYQGPASGSVASGITKSTDSFTNIRLVTTPFLPRQGKKSESEVNFMLDMQFAKPNNYSNNDSYNRANCDESNNISTELNFEGPSFPSCWVPDCNVVSGPQDVLIAINTMFWITDRNGNLLKQINTNSWFTEFIDSGLVFDPKCSYDSLSNRFIMTYLYFHRNSQTSLALLCVSDDSTAEGSWNIWSLPADLNGMTQENLWADFPSLTVTEDAIYYAYEMLFYNVVNQKYDKLRVIKKEDVLNISPGIINYVDYWDFRKPTNPSQSILFLRLTHDLDHSEYMYMISRDPAQFTSNDIFVYKMKDLLSINHQIEVFNVETSYFSLPPHMVQKDGGKPMQLFGILYHEGVLRHGKIYLSHAVSSQSSQFSDIHYVEISVDSMEMVKELFVGNPGLSYGFSDLMVDANGNVIMVYNRSGTDEYPGAYFSVMPTGSNNFINDITLAEGQGNLNQFCTNGNSEFLRFGDYSDISFDALDKNNVWLMSEYISSDNRWKTRIAKISIDEILSNVDDSELILDFYLSQNYPNPFNPTTNFEFQIADQGFVSLVIYDLLGNEITTLINKELPSGIHKVEFDGTGLPSGTYFYRLETDNHLEAKKMILLR